MASTPLACSEDGGHAGHMGHGGGAMTTPQCRAGDSPFLTTLAWCINSTCAEFNIEAWRLEKYWRDKSTGDAAVLPKWGYAQALQQVTQPPRQELKKKVTLNFTATVSRDSWDAEKRTMEHFEEQETLHARYGLVLLITGFSTPILFTLLGYLPYMTGILDKIKPYLVYPSAIGTYQVRPLPYLLGNAPTVGQSLYVALFFILNVILTAVNYPTTQPNTWFETPYQEIMAYLSCRTGVLAFALAPLVILFSGRNNILLWVTNWPHSTYMLLHRWIARLFGVQVIVHSIVELVLYIDMGTFEEETKKPYWIWGIVATLAACIMLVASLLYMRRWSYEVFLITHVIMALFVLVGSWYHVELLFTRKWGYEFWLYAACAVWFFDYVLRVLRVAKVGVRRAKVTEIGTNFVRVDVEGVRWAALPGHHAYAYFPTLSPLKPWENHPFSIIPTPVLRSSNHSILKPDGSSQSATSEDGDVEKSGGLTTATEVPPRMTTTAGVSLYIRKSNGITKFLKSHDRMITLLEGPYPNNPTKAVLTCDRLLLIGGGIGITGLLPFVNCHTNVNLCWSIKESAECIIRDLNPVLNGIAEKQVKVGQRLDVNAILSQEAQGGWKKIGVVVCGPGGLCDDVRAAVAKAGRKGKVVFELEVDAFSW